MKTYHKLIRDKIPEVINAKGEKANVRVLNDREYKQALLDKLVEEAVELRESPGDISERADVAEVLRALDEVFGFTNETIEAAVKQKNQERGAFKKRLYLETVE